MEGIAELLAAWHGMELSLAETLGVSISVMQYTLAFFLSFPLSALLGFIPTVSGRHLYAILSGIALLYYPFGLSLAYILIPATVTYVAMVVVPRHAGAVAWMFVMPYLIYWHEIGASGTAWREGKIDFTGALMVATLKLISCATNLSDSYKDSKSLRPSEKTWMIRSAPDPLAFLSFVFCCGNLLAGPHFHIKPYLEFMERRQLWSSQAARPMPNPLPQGLLHFAQALGCLVMHLALTHLGYGSMAFTEDWFFQKSFHSKIFFIWLIGFCARWKYYFVWSVAHSCMVVSGFSFEGYTEAGDPKWDCGRNQHIWRLELCNSGAEVPINWNIQTGMWLRNYVYDRLTPVGKKPGFVALLATQLISAVWHGLFAGYLMFFSGVAVMVFQSRVIYRYQKNAKGAVRMIVTGLHTLLTSMSLNFLAAAFQLLTWNESIRVWHSVYYYILVCMAVICTAGQILPKPRQQPSSKGQGSGAQAQVQENEPAANGTAHVKEM